MSQYPEGLTFEQKLDVELARRAINTSFIFVLVAITAFIWPFGVQRHADLFRGASLALVIVNIVRLICARKILSSGVPEPRVVRIFKLVIAVNSILWPVLTSLQFYESKLSGVPSFIGLFIACAFSVGSTTSLAPSRWLGFWVQTTIFVPIMLVALWLHYTTGNPSGFPLAIIQVITLLYSYKQVVFVRTDLLNSIRFEESLIQSNKELFESRRQLAEETAKNIHSSRLASLGEMAGGIAHEVNNPLMVMQGHAQHVKRMLLTEMDEPSRRLAGERIEKLLNAVFRVAQIVRGLRLFSQQGETLPFEKVKLSQVVRDTLDFCQEKMRNSGVLMKVDIPEDVVIHCRPVQISQVLINLINNAFDAIESLPEKWIEIHATVDQGIANIHLRDSGKGIPKDMEAKLFQPFFTSKGAGKGTGLGLSISQGIMRDHQGDIVYVSGQPNTTFNLKIPVVEQQASSAS